MEILMRARIFKPAKNAMQSGKAKTQNWRLEYEPAKAKTKDGVMGYTSSSDMHQQIKLNFADKDAAIAYAEKHNIVYDVVEPTPTFRRGVSYDANFRHDRKGTWTH